MTLKNCKKFCIFLGGNPLPNFFRSPLLLKINPAYAPDSNPCVLFRYW